MSDPRLPLTPDYEQTTSLLRTLTDVRFKLLSFVPTISGAATAVLGHGHTRDPSSGPNTIAPWDVARFSSSTSLPAAAA